MKVVKIFPAILASWTARGWSKLWGSEEESENEALAGDWNQIEPPDNILRIICCIYISYRASVFS